MTYARWCCINIRKPFLIERVRVYQSLRMGITQKKDCCQIPYNEHKKYTRKVLASRSVGACFPLPIIHFLRNEVSSFHLKQLVSAIYCRYNPSFSITFAKLLKIYLVRVPYRKCCDFFRKSLFVVKVFFQFFPKNDCKSFVNPTMLFSFNFFSIIQAIPFH